MFKFQPKTRKVNIPNNWIYKPHIKEKKIEKDIYIDMLPKPLKILCYNNK